MIRYFGALAALLCLFGALLPAQAEDSGGREYYVDNEQGDDAASGLSAVPGEGGSGPVRTLEKAVSLLKPGDTLHLANNSTPYRETLLLKDTSGEPGRPIVIDGHGATITGTGPLRVEDWTEEGPGLFANDKLLPQLQESDDAARVQRIFFLFNGSMQRMGRSSKGNQSRRTLKAPGDLLPGEWTFDKETHTFYIKTEGSLAEANIEVPYRENCVALRGRKGKGVQQVIIRNLIATHALNDGFNFHGHGIRDVLLENIAAYECGDDGYSAHADVQTTVNGFWASGNSTGMTNAVRAVTKASNLHLEGNFAVELFSMHDSWNEVKDSVIIASAGATPFKTGRPLETGNTLILENVLVSSLHKSKIVVFQSSSLEARHVTVVGAEWEIKGKASVADSVVAGKGVAVLEEGAWKGERNVYNIVLSDTAAQDDIDSVNKEVPSDLPQQPGQPFAPAGADSSRMKIPPQIVPLSKNGMLNQ